MNLITYLSHNKGLPYLVRQPLVVYTGFCITGFVSEAGLVELAERIQHILCLMTYAGWLLLCREITVTNEASSCRKRLWKKIPASDCMVFNVKFAAACISTD